MDNKFISKKIFIKITVLGLVSIALFLLVLNNFNWYKTPVMEVTQITSDKQTQLITGTIKNTQSKGLKLTVVNEYDKSLAYDNKYHKGDYLFVKIEENTQEELNNEDQVANYNLQIIDQKRDYILLIPILLLLCLLILVGKMQGMLTILGLIVNIIIFTFALNLYNKGTNIIGISIILCIVFSFIVLVLVNGFNKKTLIAELATLSATGVISILAFFILKFGPGVSYDFLGFLPEPFTAKDARMLFLAEIMIGSLGAIMDISVTITSTVSELLTKDPSISKKALVKSAREVSDDITGTMINVVLFTNMAAILPVFIISLKNDFHFTTILNNNVIFEITRFLTGGTAIILAIPFSILITSFFYKHKGGIS